MVLQGKKSDQACFLFIKPYDFIVLSNTVLIYRDKLIASDSVKGVFYWAVLANSYNIVSTIFNRLSMLAS